MKMNILDRELTPLESLIFFGVATMGYIYPLILADYFYLDDSWEAQQANLALAVQGRILAEWLYHGLTFTQGAPNIFPLPLLIATLAMSFALKNLATHYFGSLTISRCLVVLPMWYNPFFLQNLSYQYDGPSMTLGLIAIMYAITFRAAGKGAQVWQIVIPAMLIAMSLALYQVNINVFAGLCCMEIVKGIDGGITLKNIRRLVLSKLAQLAIAIIAYCLTAYRLLLGDRVISWFGYDGVTRVKADLYTVVGKVALIYNDANAWLCWALLVVAGMGFLCGGVRLFRAPGLILTKGVRGIVYLMVVPVLLMSVAGVGLFFEPFDDGARLLLGFSVVLVFLFHFSHQWLVSVNARLGVLLIIPLLGMLSLSYAYGRVLSLQKGLENSIAYSIAYDISSHKNLREMSDIYMIVNAGDGWLPGGDGTLRSMPVLKYILNVGFFVESNVMPRFGIANVVNEDAKHNEKVINSGNYKPLVDGRFYNIYVVGGDGYIVMKQITDVLTYQ